jgi:hypothetical protein
MSELRASSEERETTLLSLALIWLILGVNAMTIATAFSPAAGWGVLSCLVLWQVVFITVYAFDARPGHREYPDNEAAARHCHARLLVLACIYAGAVGAVVAEVLLAKR